MGVRWHTLLLLSSRIGLGLGLSASCCLRHVDLVERRVSECSSEFG